MDGAPALCVSHPGPVGCGCTDAVFLSFPRGSDTASDSFPGRLFARLRAEAATAGFSVCRPNENLAVGSSSQLPGVATLPANICIPIFSKDYPSDQQCLRDLVQMMKGWRRDLQMVWPIYYRVEPGDVRRLQGSFKMARHSDIEGVQSALEDVSWLQAWMVADEFRPHRHPYVIYSLSSTRGDEELVNKVVETVLRRLQTDFDNDYWNKQYDVFLNFRGFDTRQGFTYDLYNALKAVKLEVFKDDTEIPIGVDFRLFIPSAIRRSKIYITIVSRNYTSSKWTLLELAEMRGCVDKMGHIFYPIYYHVDQLNVARLGKTFELRPREEAPETEEGLQVLQEVAERSDRLGIGPDEDDESSDGLELEPDENRSNFHLAFIGNEVLDKLRNHFQLDIPKDVENSLPQFKCVIS